MIYLAWFINLLVGCLGYFQRFTVTHQSRQFGQDQVGQKQID